MVGGSSVKGIIGVLIAVLCMDQLKTEPAS